MVRWRNYGTLLLAASVLLAGCAQEAETEAVTEAPEPTPDTASGEAPVAEEASSATEPAGEAPDFYTFTLEPTAEGIPDQPVAGNMRGERFDVNQVLVDFDKGTWTLRFLDQPLEDMERVASGGHYLMIKLDEKPEVGKVYEAEAKPGVTMWQMPDAESHTGSTSYNSSGAYVLEFTQWTEDKAFEEQRFDPYQSVGTASGRIAFNYKGINEDPNSWLAGTFEDAVIRLKDDPEAPAAEGDATP